MKRMTLLVAAGLFAAVIGGRAYAHGDEHGHKNLKVLQEDHKAIDNGMKSFAKGLGVKCEACHIKGKFDKDDVATKLEARKFFGSVVGQADAAKKKAALDELLRALKLAAPKDEAKIWQAVSAWKKQS